MKMAANRGCARRCPAFAGLVSAAIVAAACGPPAVERIALFDASDETSDARIDHGDWQEILDRYVAADSDGVNLVDYDGLAASAGDRAKLAGYLDRLQRIDPRDHSRAEQLAYWINFYNALTLQVVLDAYPVETIRDVHEGVVPYTGPWGDPHARVAGRQLSLDDIEHGVLRPIWRDARIHYAVNCAAYGCPHLLETAFTAENAGTLLEAGARAYVNSPRGVNVVSDGSIVLSSIYEWYSEDFGGTEEAVLAHLIEYADDPLAVRLEGFRGAVDYDYDWSLNRRGRDPGRRDKGS